MWLYIVQTSIGDPSVWFKLWNWTKCTLQYNKESAIPIPVYLDWHEYFCPHQSSSWHLNENVNFCTNYISLATSGWPYTPSTNPIPAPGLASVKKIQVVIWDTSSISADFEFWTTFLSLVRLQLVPLICGQNAFECLKM